jgi:hypothetical protein
MKIALFACRPASGTGPERNLQRLRRAVSKSYKSVFDTFLLVANRSAMPCRSDEEFALGPEQPNAVTPSTTGRRRNAGAGKDKSDAKIRRKIIQMLKPTMIGASSRTVPVPILKRGRGCARF